MRSVLLAGKLATFVIFAASVAPTFAQKAGDTVINGGWFRIAPQDSSTPLTVTSPFHNSVPGSGATAEAVDTLGFSITRFLTDNWSVALDLGIPPKYKLNGTGSLSSVGRIGTAKQWAPAVLAKYFFGEANDQFRPWLGLGIAHVNYTNIELSQNFQQFVGRSFLDPNAKTTASIDNAWAPVFNAGLSYAINKDWSVALSVSYLKLENTADLTTEIKKGPFVGTAKSTTTLTLDPLVTYLSVGYRF